MKQAILPFLQISICTLGYLCTTSNITLAQVTSDGTVNTTVNQNGSVAEITGGETRGSNLFHSFQDFSVPTGNEAFFDNANNISNIFSRVTGGNLSNIDGVIRANGSASLFLINPAGIIFGENARLDIGGSFYGSTASSILFEDGEFSATDLDNPPLLTINAPIGLNFRDNPASIQNNSSASADFDSAPSFDDFLFGLRVPDGKTFALAGGDITADGGGIVAVGGRIELGAVSGEGTLGLNFEGDTISFNFPNDLPKANVTLTNNSGFLVAGNNGGDIAITANNLNLSEESGLFAGIFRGLGFEEAQAGDIVLNISESIALTQISRINNNVGNFFNIATGNSGDIFIETQNLFVQDGSAISVTTFGEGNAGDLNIRAVNSVVLSGESNFPGGLFAQVDLMANGTGGNLTIDTPLLSISNGSKVQVATFGKGNAGKLLIRSSQIDVFNTPVFSNFTTGIFGSVSLDPRTVNLPEGNGGNVTIFTEQLRVIDGGKISVSTEGIGDAGILSITAEESIQVKGVDPEPEDGTSFIGANASDTATGEGGDVNISTGQLIVSDQGAISASSQSGEGGNIELQIADNLILRNNGLISAQAFNEADGGNVNIDTNFIIAFPNQVDGNGSDIIASAAEGDGGKININAESLFGIKEGRAIDNNRTNDIDASSDFGLDGTVSIFTPDINPIQRVTELPTNVVEPTETAAQACQANREIAVKNELNIVGKGGVPHEPGLPLDSHNILVNGQSNTTFTIPEPVETSQGKIQPARGIKITETGEIILTAYRTNNAGERIPEGAINCDRT